MIVSRINFQSATKYFNDAIKLEKGEALIVPSNNFFVRVILAKRI